MKIKKMIQTSLLTSCIITVTATPFLLFACSSPSNGAIIRRQQAVTPTSQNNNEPKNNDDTHRVIGQQNPLGGGPSINNGDNTDDQHSPSTIRLHRTSASREPAVLQPHSNPIRETMPRPQGQDVEESEQTILWDISTANYDERISTDDILAIAKASDINVSVGALKLVLNKIRTMPALEEQTRISMIVVKLLKAYESEGDYRISFLAESVGHKVKWNIDLKKFADSNLRTYIAPIVLGDSMIRPSTSAQAGTVISTQGAALKYLIFHENSLWLSFDGTQFAILKNNVFSLSGAFNVKFVDQQIFAFNEQKMEMVDFSTAISSDVRYVPSPLSLDLPAPIVNPTIKRNPNGVLLILNSGILYSGKIGQINLTPINDRFCLFSEQKIPNLLLTKFVQAEHIERGENPNVIAAYGKNGDTTFLVTSNDFGLTFLFNILTSVEDNDVKDIILNKDFLSIFDTKLIHIFVNRIEKFSFPNDGNVEENNFFIAQVNDKTFLGMIMDVACASNLFTGDDVNFGLAKHGNWLTMKDNFSSVKFLDSPTITNNVVGAHDKFIIFNDDNNEFFTYCLMQSFNFETAISVSHAHNVMLFYNEYETSNGKLLINVFFNKESTSD